PVNDDHLVGHELCIESNDFFLLDHQPKRVVVQGAGYIALELACILSNLGSEVHVVYRGARILRGFDTELQGHLEAELGQAGLNLHANKRIIRVEERTHGLGVIFDDGGAMEVDAVLKAIGRKPRTENLGLGGVGITLDAPGAIPVDD
ncbi:MAG: FAD-dependent oxidoreductase, partial [bacterium]